MYKHVYCSGRPRGARGQGPRMLAPMICNNNNHDTNNDTDNNKHTT